MWEESFCCYVLWESPVWRMYGQAGFLRPDTALLCRSTAQATAELPAEECFEKPVPQELSVCVRGESLPTPIHSSKRDRNKVQTASVKERNV